MKTSKIILLSLLLFLLKSPSFSQAFSTRDGWGIVVGGNFSDIVGRSVQIGNEPKFGLRAGFSLESTAVNQFYFRSELLYNQKGARISAGIGQQTAILQTYHTLEIPVLGCFEFTKGVGIGGGLYGAYLIDSQLESQFGGTTVPIQFQENDLRRLELGYAVELNFFKQEGLQGGLRYQRSISTINNSIDRYHQVVSAYIGILFNNGG
ncbi:outer membrane beta-barrel protein [Hyphobacterium sp. CCMP332]|nr:outer membrane beta-barrel protein [Hyphobacterium sp. CCMP332]